MPSAAPRHVEFAPIPASSRPADADERYVMKKFAKHASHCPTCAHPYELHRQGGTLCSKGHHYALDVDQYIVSESGKVFSVVDLDSRKSVQVEIPTEYAVVRELLRALERGLRLRRNVKPISYDATFPVPPRIIQAGPGIVELQQREPRHVRKPVLETTLPPPTLVRTYSRRDRDRPSTFGRGSLYESDMKEARRQKEQKEQQRRRSTYYNVGSRGVLPVPPKPDYYYP